MQLKPGIWISSISQLKLTAIDFLMLFQIVSVRSLGLLTRTPCIPFRVSFDPEDLRIEGNPFRVNPLSGGLTFFPPPDIEDP